MLKQLKTIFRDAERPEVPGPRYYTNSQGRQLHMLDCECGGCTIRPRHYRRALKELSNG